MFEKPVRDIQSMKQMGLDFSKHQDSFWEN